MRVAIYIVAINIFAFLLYGFDKSQAKAGGRRISEASLLFVALIGGSVGAYAGMKVFHHKTKKAKFHIGVPLIIAVHFALLLLKALA